MYKCSLYIPHHFYNPLLCVGKGLYDLAIVKVMQRISFGYQNRAMLAPCLPHYGRYGTFIGLGLTNQNPDEHPIQLMEAILEVDENYGEQD